MFLGLLPVRVGSYFTTHPKMFKAALIAIALLIVAGCYAVWARHERGVGKVEERKQVVTEVAHDTASQVATAAGERNATVGAARQEYTAAGQVIAAQELAIAAQNQTIATLKDRVAAANEKAKNTPDADLDASITEALGEPANTPQAKRRILAAVSSVDSLSAAVRELQDGQKKQEAIIGKMGEQIAAKQKEVDAERKFGDKALDKFTQLYNAQGLKKRGWQCLKVWRCAPDRVSVPSPAELAKERQK